MKFNLSTTHAFLHAKWPVSSSFADIITFPSAHLGADMQTMRFFYFWFLLHFHSLKNMLFTIFTLEMRTQPQTTLASVPSLVHSYLNSLDEFTLRPKVFFLGEITCLVNSGLPVIAQEFPGIIAERLPAVPVGNHGFGHRPACASLDQDIERLVRQFDMKHVLRGLDLVPGIGQVFDIFTSVEYWNGLVFLQDNQPIGRGAEIIIFAIWIRYSI